MNKNGFTLVELLVVILILGLLVAIVVPTANNVATKSKIKMCNTKIELIREAAELWGQKNRKIIFNSTSITKTFKELADMGVIDYDNGNEILNPINNENLNDKQVKITINNNSISAEIVNLNDICK